MLKDRNGFQAIDVIIAPRKLSDIKRMILSPPKYHWFFSNAINCIWKWDPACWAVHGAPRITSFVRDIKTKLSHQREKSINVMAQSFGTTAILFSSTRFSQRWVSLSDTQPVHVHRTVRVHTGSYNWLKQRCTCIRLSQEKGSHLKYHWFYEVGFRIKVSFLNSSCNFFSFRIDMKFSSLSFSHMRMFYSFTQTPVSL